MMRRGAQVNTSDSCRGLELRTRRTYSWWKGDIFHGAVVQGPSAHAKRRLPSGTHYCTTPRAKARVPRNFTCWQRAGGPGGWLAQALVAWGAGLTLEA